MCFPHKSLAPKLILFFCFLLLCQTVAQLQINNSKFILFFLRFSENIDKALPFLKIYTSLITEITTWTTVDIYRKPVCKCTLLYFYAPATKNRGGGTLIYPCPSVHPSGYRYMVCQANSSYSFGATALIFCRMFIRIMEVCMSTGFWFSSNILKMTGSWT